MKKYIKKILNVLRTIKKNINVKIEKRAANKIKNKYDFPNECHICGGKNFVFKKTMWKELINTWELNENEEELINIQQNLRCTQCNSNLRSMNLAKALSDYFNSKKNLKTLVESRYEIGELKILEINEAGSLNEYLSKVPNHIMKKYPEIDITKTNYSDSSWDLIIHSDTLEHIKDHKKALTECKRILKNGGAMIFTIPVLPNRMTRRRYGLQPSYHGSIDGQDEGNRVWSEYGADFWVDLAECRFSTITISPLLFPASIAITVIK